MELSQWDLAILSNLDIRDSFLCQCKYAVRQMLLVEVYNLLDSGDSSSLLYIRDTSKVPRMKHYSTHAKYLFIIHWPKPVKLQVFLIPSKKIEQRRNKGSCVLRKSVVECQSILLINTLNQHVDRRPNQYSADTLSTLDQQSVNSQLSVNWLIRINWKLVDQDVDGVSIKCQLRCWWSIDQGYQLRV